MVVLERHCLALREEVEHLSERQEVLTVLMESKINMQRTAPEKYREKIFEELKELEEQRTKEALELFQRKHKLIRWEGDRERARTLQRLEASRAMGPWSGAHDNSSFGSCSSSLAFDTAPDVDEVKSESSWTALATEKEGYWWSIDLEGEMEITLGPWSGTEGGSVDPKGKMDHRSARNTKMKSRKRLNWMWMMPCLKKRVLQSRARKGN